MSHLPKIKIQKINTIVLCRNANPNYYNFPPCRQAPPAEYVEEKGIRPHSRKLQNSI